MEGKRQTSEVKSKTSEVRSFEVVNSANSATLPLCQRGVREGCVKSWQSWQSSQWRGAGAGLEVGQVPLSVS